MHRLGVAAASVILGVLLLNSCAGSGHLAGNGNQTDPGGQSTDGTQTNVPQAPETYAARFVYVASFLGQTIAGYRVDEQTGALSAISGATVFTPANVFPAYLAVHPSGKFLYISEEVTPYRIGEKWVNANLAGYRIDPESGYLTELLGSPFDHETAAVNLVISPDGRFLYVGDLPCMSDGHATTCIGAYRINEETGALMPLEGSPFALRGIGVQYLALDPQGRFLFAAGAIATAGEDVFQFQGRVASFVLNQQTGEPVQIGDAIRTGLWNSGTQPTVDAQGRFLYVGIAECAAHFPQAEYNNRATAIFRIHADGSLEAVPNSPFLLGTCNPSQYLADPGGRFIYEIGYRLGNDSTGIWPLRIDPQADTPTAVPGSPFPVVAPDLDQGAALDPSGRFLYVVNGLDIPLGYQIDQSTGIPQPLPTNRPLSSCCADLYYLAIAAYPKQ